ncbi:DUF2378 family protein [Cystobacter fuscus]|uniref:TIGR02265 family protein n=1 Tax=Cystobacter fuscus TaxID=43 RepID=UPI002B28C4DA|nr:DUF2378 family protein [Cystobacter fuscus]
MEHGAQQELERRLEVIRPEDTLRGFFFNGVLEQVRPLGDPVSWRRCIEAAGGDRFMAFFSYPMDSFIRLLYAAAGVLSEGRGDFRTALWHLGREMVPYYLESSAGQVLLLLARGEPRWLLEGLPSAFRTAVRHGECSVSWLGPNHGRLLFQGCTLPAEYYEGAVRGVFESTRIAQTLVSARQVNLLDTEVEVSWDKERHAAGG